MRNLRWLHFISLCVSFICLMASFAFAYDSSMQRSNFLSITPKYEKKLEKELESRRAAFLWKLGLEGQSLQTDQNINSTAAIGLVRTKFRYKLLDNLDLKSQLDLRIRSGRSQTIFGDQFNETSIYAQELKLAWSPIEDVLSIDAGVISQSFFNNGLFLSRRGFPGLSEKIQYKTKRFEIGLRAQQLIPTSTTQSTRVADREETPSLLTQSLETKISLSSNNFINGRFTLFNYDDLPHVVAFAGGQQGNTLGAGASANNAAFAYDFKGWQSDITFEQKLSNNFSMQAQLHLIKNTAAPDDSAESQSVRIFGAYDFGRWIIGGTYNSYFIESDAVPASYNSHFLGSTNRIGNAYEINLESKKWGIQFSAMYVDADLLAPSTNVGGIQQDNQQTIYFQVGTMYDFI